MDASGLSDDELHAILWEAGDVDFLMHAGQLRLDKQFHAWRLVDQIEQVHETGSIPLVFAVKGGKRFGKTSWALWTAHKLAVWYARTFGRPCSMRYTSAFQTTIDEIIGKVVPQCFQTAPASCEPRYHGKRGIKPAGLWWPEQGPTLGANLALSGLDQNKNALRGQSNDFDFISEAAFIRYLDYTVRNVLIHQYQQRPWARMVVETSAPDVLGTDWEMIVLPDAEARGACFSATIDDNPLLSERERALYISMAGGRGSANCEREYYNVIAASPEQQVVPEFTVEKHVKASERPPYAVALAALDPGMRDIFGILWGYWDVLRGKLVIERDWSKRNASTAAAAKVIRETELELYGDAAELLGEEQWMRFTKPEEWTVKAGLIIQKPTEFDSRKAQLRRKTKFGLKRPAGLCWWDGKEFRGNPLYRVSDIDARMIGDLNIEHGIGVINTAKDDAEAALNALRTAFQNDKIEIHPRCVDTISHVRTARWNKSRLDYERTEHHGHYDLLDALVYMWRMVQSIRGQNPSPPEFVDRNEPGVVFVTPPQQVSHDVRKLRDVFGGKRQAWR